MISKDFSNNQLINYVYTQIAGQMIREKVQDFSSPTQWQETVDHMPKPVAVTYRIGILNLQVMNGGFIQYFDNRYGIFAEETLLDLQIIGALKTYNLLKQCLDVINPAKYTGINFVNYVYSREYEIDYTNLAAKLDVLDNQYYNLGEVEDFEQMLGTYLRQHIGELQ